MTAVCAILAFYVLIQVVIGSDSAESSVLNIYGGPLEQCSHSGMALTGFTRDGYCTDINGDTGSHHICIDLSSTTGGNFCSVTGQSDWCSSSMTCHDALFDEEEDEDNYCPVQDWCVCQWAFASYLQYAGGCDKIQDLVCEAINMQAALAYKSMAGITKYDNALRCIESRCGVSLSKTGTSALLAKAMNNKAGIVYASSLLIAASAVAFFTWNRTQQMQGKREHLVKSMTESYA
mmetsp:Transcript_35517/g.53743  ORF Transcript_35517/g.53743 Transcript_35517/m.53743 type:complete len:234 (-) Transcript_35517:184-885(-)